MAARIPKCIRKSGVVLIHQDHVIAYSLDEIYIKHSEMVHLDGNRINDTSDFETAFFELHY